MYFMYDACNQLNPQPKFPWIPRYHSWLDSSAFNFDMVDEFN